MMRTWLRILAEDLREYDLVRFGREGEVLPCQRRVAPELEHV